MGLYSKAGYEVEKEDCILVGLLNDRRQLLSKFLPRRKDTTNGARGTAVQSEENSSSVPEYWQ